MIPDLLIRAAERSDERAIASVLQKALLDSLAPDDPRLSALLEQLSHKPTDLCALRYYYIAEHEGVPIGCGGWGTEFEPGSWSLNARLRRFAVDPAWTRRGVGRALADRCLSDAASASMTLVRVRSSLEAVPFYAALGFATVKPSLLVVDETSALPCVWMQRSVQASDRRV